MPRRFAYEVPVDTSLFTPLQLQPRALLALGMTGWAHWLKEYLVSFPRLIRDHHFGVVVVGIHTTYARPYSFFDADSLRVDTGVRVLKGGSLLEVSIDYRPPGGETVAKVLVLLRPVLLGEGASMAAVAGKVPGTLLERFEADEIDAGSPPRVVPALVEDLERSGPPLASGNAPFVLRRHHCEAADQWCFMEVPGMAGGAREGLCFDGAREHPELKKGLRSAIRQFDVELRKPAFLLDGGRIETRAWARADELAVAHRIVAADGELLATVVERL
jgi:hypothetical protein